MAGYFNNIKKREFNEMGGPGKENKSFGVLREQAEQRAEGCNNE